MASMQLYAVVVITTNNSCFSEWAMTVFWRTFIGPFFPPLILSRLRLSFSFDCYYAAFGVYSIVQR